jgi:hypothetical protein
MKNLVTLIDTDGEDGFACQIKHLRIIASWGGGWEHVSVSTWTKKCPTWEDMCFIKDVFWNDDECVIQYHPARENYINNVSNCLHLWKPQNQEIPIPPKIFVGI